MGVPINQEDLAGTLLTFSFLAIDGLRKLGANISSEAADAYFYAWCGIGRVLGVLPEMIPCNLEEVAELKELISLRQFAPSDEGRQMTQALIGMLQKNSPPLLEGIRGEVGESRAAVSPGEVQRGPLQPCVSVLLSSGRLGVVALRLNESTSMNCLALHPTRRAPLARDDLPSDKGRLEQERTPRASLR